jgi:hypothetical protein
VVKACKLSGVKGTTVLNNSAVVFSSASDGVVQDCEMTGMSGYATYVTASDHIKILDNYVHGLTPDLAYINGCDIGLYQTTSYCTVRGNWLAGGAQTEVGVLMQLDSTKNLVDGNLIHDHYSYGVLDYDTTPRTTNSIIVNNRIENIDGAANGAGTKGAGIYCAGTGGQVLANNQIKNTNINTTTETLVPGSIGINNAFSPLVINSNVISNPIWYGIMTASCTQTVSITNNVLFECNKLPIYLKSSSHGQVVGNSVTSLTATPLTQRGIAANVAGGGPWTGVIVNSNRVRGSNRAIEIVSTDNTVVSGNNISEVNGISIRIATANGIVVSGNVGDSTTSASASALDVSGAQNCTYSNNVWKSTSTTCVSFAGTNTGSVFDETNIIVVAGVRGDMNNINNTTAGTIVTQYGTAAPTVLNHQVGDTVINSVPAAGGIPGWRCTTAGLPGTWKAMAVLAA